MTSSANVELRLSECNAAARGPTNFSHWVIPGQLLASAYPAERNEDAQRVMTEQLIVNSSIEVIVNLMEEEELKSFTPYRAMMLEYAQQASLLRPLEFLSFPIRDRHIHQDNQAVLQFCLGLCQRLKEGKKMLIHCWGGHGRTGTIVAILIGILFHLPSDEAIRINRELHEQRVRTNGVPSPETKAQLEQVRIVLDELLDSK